MGAPEQGMPLLIRIAVKDLAPSPTNPRKVFPQKEHEEMVASIRAQGGVMSPLLVRPWPAHYKHAAPRPKYEIIAGERRYRGSKDAPVADVLAVVRTDLTDTQVIELQLIENLQRVDLSPFDEGDGYRKLMDEFGYTVEMLVEKIGKPRTHVYNTLLVTRIVPEGRKAFAEGLLTASTAHLIARIPGVELQRQACKGLTQGRTDPMPFRAAQEYVQNSFMLTLADAPFPRGDTELVPGLPRCFECPKRTGNQPEAFQDIKSKDVCTDPECYQAKCKANLERVRAEAKADGRRVLSAEQARKDMAPWGVNSSLRNGYVRLDETCYGVQVGGSYKTYRQILGKDFKAPVLIEHDRKPGHLVEVALEKDVKELMNTMGVLKRETSSAPSSNPHKEQERKARFETEYRMRLFIEIRKAADEDIGKRAGRTGGLDEVELRLMTETFYNRVGFDNQKLLLKLWLAAEEEGGKKIEVHERIRRLETRIETMSRADLSRMLIDLAVVGELHVCSWGLNSKPLRLQALAERWAVNAKSLRAQMTAVDQAKTKAKVAKEKAAAAKKAAPTINGASAAVAAKKVEKEDDDEFAKSATKKAVAAKSRTK